MNLYPTRRSPVACPRDLADRHVRTQIGDVAIMLATSIVLEHPEKSRAVVARLGPELIGPFEHGCVTWCAEWPENWSWGWLQLGALHDEYEHRTGSSHPQRDRVIALMELAAGESIELATQLRVLGLTEPPEDWPRSKAGRATGIDNDHHSARQELAWRYSQWSGKGRPPQWTRRTRPEWLTDQFGYQ